MSLLGLRAALWACLWGRGFTPDIRPWIKSRLCYCCVWMTAAVICCLPVGLFTRYILFMLEVGNELCGVSLSVSPCSLSSPAVRVIRLRFVKKQSPDTDPLITQIVSFLLRCVNNVVKADEFKWPSHQPSSSLCRCPHSRSSPAMSDHPWTRPDLHPAKAAPRVGHYSFLHHHGHHLPHSHLWAAGGITLASRSHKIRPLDCLHW